MFKRNILIILTSIVFSFSVCLHAEESHTIEYGNVSSVLITTADSKILESSIIGGALGMAIGENTQSTLDGAAAGFAIASIMEGDRRVFLYTINVHGKEQKIAMEEGGIGEGRCVAIETEGSHTNVRAVSSAFCQQSEHEALSSVDVVKQQQSQAEQCKSAREVVLQAETDIEIDNALVKVRALCE